MKVLKTIFLIVPLSLMACGGSVADGNDLAAVEQSVEAKNYDLAQSICGAFVTDSTTSLNVGELCRLSVVYMRLSDVKDEDENTASALQCLRTALKLNADSVQSFYNNLPVDQARHIQMLMQLDSMIDGYITAEPDSLYFEPVDSIVE